MLEGIAVSLFSFNDYPDLPEIVEDGETFLDNALKKARVVSAHTGEIVIADDSGIEIDFLRGEPGVFSSRYSGPDATDESNIEKLLRELKGVPLNERGATFRCVLVLCKPDGSFESFEGKWRGRVGYEPAGDKGFGYDPVFVAPEFGVTAAELSPEIKNSVSHRALAFAKLKKSLQEKVR
jgi:non-canonical purine NTP pyrophosphatase, rdgB/HAM1 family